MTHHMLDPDSQDFGRGVSGMAASEAGTPDVEFARAANTRRHDRIPHCMLLESLSLSKP